MSRLDYSKWDHIEVSDDEDDTHPNIDTGSLFRWRHQARVERMEQSQKEKDELESGKKDHQQKIQQQKNRLKEAENSQLPSEKLQQMKLDLSELEKQEDEWRKKEEELTKKEQATPWNIDTICHEGKTRTVINKETKPAKENLSDEQKSEKYSKFVKKYKDDIKKYGMFQHYDDSQKFLVENRHLVCEETANYLVIWCIDLEMEEKKSLMDHVSHQAIVMQFILELAQQLDRDPRECVGPFFSRIKLAEKQYSDSFNEELDAFKSRVRARAKVKLDEAIEEYEQEEREKRLGPGGLDPVEVFESLPEVLKECFESKDVSKLQDVILTLPRDQAEYHMERCVQSGLWVRDAKEAGLVSAAEEAAAKEAGLLGTRQEDEPEYTNVASLD